MNMMSLMQLGASLVQLHFSSSFIYCRRLNLAHFNSYSLRCGPFLSAVYCIVSSAGTNFLPELMIIITGYSHSISLETPPGWFVLVLGILVFSLPMPCWRATTQRHQHDPYLVSSTCHPNSIHGYCSSYYRYSHPRFH